MTGHGTYSAYQRGCKCADCRAACARYMREYRKNADARKRELTRNEAERRALQRLRRFHPTDYRAFYETELYELEREAMTRPIRRRLTPDLQ